LRLSRKELDQWQDKRVTLLGMSGVGKTHIANILRRSNWFHYSADYRIGTRYLDEPILDNIKQQAMHVEFLRDLLRTDSIYISNNITVDNLHPVSSFLGKLGDPNQGGLTLKEFKRRQALHIDAEIAAMNNVPEFIDKAKEIYGYQHFVNDSSGSLCELDSPQVIKLLAEHTLILYIRATDQDERELLQRAKDDPKPLFYRESFLEEQLETYMRERGVDVVSKVPPNDFTRWVFPALFRARIPRYEAIAKEHGYTVTTDEIGTITSEDDFLRVLGAAVERGT